MLATTILLPFCVLLVTLAGVVDALGDKYLLGVGRGDITGPVVEVPLHGYASPDQTGSGVRQRIYARSFIVADVNKPSNRILYIIADVQSADTGVRKGILEGLKNKGGDYAQYTSHNVAFVATHSHAGPGGWQNYLLHQLPSLGFNKQSYDAIVAGVLLSITRAHESLQEGYLDVGTTDVVEGSINRSLWSYLANPESERAKYGSSTDAEMTVLRFRRASDGKSIGLLSWYAVHGTSAYSNNTLVNGDNKGVAAYLTEKAFGDGFVAGFSQASVGDVSPNVLGQWCDDGSSKECTLKGSTCADGTVVHCRGRGPKFTVNDNGLSSTFEIGRRQFAAAETIMKSLDASGTPIVGPTVKSFHFFQDMRNFVFPSDGKMLRTCPAGLGFSFAAGTTDGPGRPDFAQGSTTSTSAHPFWRFLSGLLRPFSAEQKACQGPKRILIDLRDLAIPYSWVPNIVDVQLMRVGQFVIIVAPVEATTMAGRRWRKAVRTAARAVIPDGDPIVVLGGPANTYAHYCTTPEEYDEQRYEGASTLYGRYTLPAFINLTTSAMPYLSPAANSLPPVGPSPPDNRRKSFSLVLNPFWDSAPSGQAFGQVLAQPEGSYLVGSTVSVRFQGANPRNNLRLENTYASVEQLIDGEWVQIRSDYDWSLEFSWRRTSLMLPNASEVTIKWYTADDNVGPGTYRIRYYGDSKRALSATTTPFEGIGDPFDLV